MQATEGAVQAGQQTTDHPAVHLGDDAGRRGHAVAQVVGGVGKRCCWRFDGRPRSEGCVDDAQHVFGVTWFGDSQVNLWSFSHEIPL